MAGRRPAARLVRMWLAPARRYAYIWGVTSYSAVVTTGIYCRPGCGAKPLAENVRTFELAASAEAAGFRACLRCRPYRTAGPVVAGAPELVCRAVQLIIDGALDAGTETSLGARLAVSPRHLRRVFTGQLGVTPDQLARSRRAHFARRLLDDTDLTVADVAFASGFASIRQFNRQMREVFRASPSELRDRRRRADRLAADGGLTMRLPFEPPFDWDAMVAFFAGRAVPGVEAVSGRVYRRTISLDGAPGVLEVHPGGADHLLLRAHLPSGSPGPGQGGTAAEYRAHPLPAETGDALTVEFCRSRGERRCEDEVTGGPRRREPEHEPCGGHRGHRAYRQLPGAAAGPGRP